MRMNTESISDSLLESHYRQIDDFVKGRMVEGGMIRASCCEAVVPLIEASLITTGLQSELSSGGILTVRASYGVHCSDHTPRL